MDIELDDQKIIADDRSVWYRNNLNPGDKFVIKIKSTWKVMVCDKVIHHNRSYCGYCGTKHPDLVSVKGLPEPISSSECFKVLVHFQR